MTFLFSFFLVLPSLASASTSDPSPEQSPFLRPGVLKKVSLSFTAVAAAAARPNCTGDSFSRRMSVYEIILFTIPAVSSLARLITKEVFFLYLILQEWKNVDDESNVSPKDESFAVGLVSKTSRVIQDIQLSTSQAGSLFLPSS